MTLKNVFLSGFLFLLMLGCEKEDESAGIAVPTITQLSPGSGPVGAQVSISGTNFSNTIGENEVYFTQGQSSAAANIQNATTSLLQVEVPATLVPGDYAVVVKTKGVAVTASDLFSVTRTPHTVTALSSTTVYADGSLSITGTNFSTTASENIVILIRESAEPVTASVSAATATSLNINFPENITPAEYTVRVTIGELSIDADSKLTINAPVPPPTVGAIDVLVYAGSTTTISGTNFSSIAAENQVHLVSGSTTIEATVTGAASTVIQATVPASTPAGEYKVRVTVGGKSAESSSVLTVLVPHTITSFTPTTAEAGSRIVITGTNFSTTPSENSVKLNQDGFLFTLQVIEASETSITAQIPTNIFSGNHFLEVTIDNLKVRATQTFTLGEFSTPAITSVSPTTVAAGSNITITGSNFSYDSEVLYVVMIKDGSTNRQYATIVSATPTEIVAEIPGYFTPANYTLEVHKGTKKGAAPGKITVTQ